MGLSDIGCAHFSPCEAAQLPLSPTPSLQPQESDDERNQLSCRVCWQSEVHEANLLSPCCCRGSQKHVHLKCLRRWQENVQKRDATDERAFRCSVCRALFSVPPPQPRATTVVVPLLRGVCALLCVALLTFGLSGPPWPHLALLLLLLLASRSHWLPGLALLTLCTVLAAMHARGLRIVLRVDGGGRLGVALIRHGAPVQGIAPGVLLVASEGLDHSMFKRSVVLLTQHGRQGARGVMLTQPMTTPPAAGHALVVDHAWADDARHGSEQPAGSNGTEADGGAEGRGSGGRRGQAQTHGGGAAREGGGLVMKHFLGGPVGMPGEGVNHEVLVLHSLAGVAGARRLLPADNDTRPAAGTTGAAAGSPAHGAAVAAADGDGAAVGELPEAFQLFEGGSINEILAKGSDAASAAASAAAAAAASRAHSRRSGRPGMAREAAVAGGQARDGVLPVLLFHGLCSWSEGQLEGELRAGAWGFVADPEPGMHSLLSLPPDQLWNALAGSANTARRA